MICELIKMQKKMKYIVSGVVFFILFMTIYTILDRLNMSYSQMRQTYGTYLVVMNMMVNVIMSLMGALMMNLGSAQVELKAGSSRGSNMGFVSVLFGIFTYGCTSCVVTFLAAMGIPLVVAVLPLAGFAYKLMSLGLLIIGFWWLLRSIKKSTCRI